MLITQTSVKLTPSPSPGGTLSNLQAEPANSSPWVYAGLIVKYFLIYYPAMPLFCPTSPHPVLCSLGYSSLKKKNPFLSNPSVTDRSMVRDLTLLQCPPALRKSFLMKSLLTTPIFVFYLTYYYHGKVNKQTRIYSRSERCQGIQIHIFTEFLE